MSLRWRCCCLLLVSSWFSPFLSAQVQVPVVTTTNTTIRVMASNLSSGNNQRYEAAGLHILKALKPDVVAIQEFNYAGSGTLGTNTPNALREMIDQTFGTNFDYRRQPSGGAITIPNGVISRYPFITNGIWEDIELPDRDFAWAQLDIPGTNDLYVVSVHIKASSGSSSVRAREATVLKSLIQTNFPANAYIILAGDMNISSTDEACLATFKTFLSDAPIPTDTDQASGGDADTNAGRSERYDYVFPSPALDALRVATVIGSKTFTKGLVFDSRTYPALSEVAPVALGDSGVTGMQHMGIVKDFKINYQLTNFIDVTAPITTLISTNILRWQGQTNLTYTVQTSSNLMDWTNAGAAFSSSTNFAFTNQAGGEPQLFYRLRYP